MTGKVQHLAARRSHWRSVFGVGFERELGDDLLQQVRDLPGTKDYFHYATRVASLAKWKHALQKGYAVESASQFDRRHHFYAFDRLLPHTDEITWPAEPFSIKFSVNHAQKRQNETTSGECRKRCRRLRC